MLDKADDFASKPLARKILFFDNMLTPSLIRLVYWLGLLAVAWTGLTNLFTNGFWGFFETIVMVVISVIGLRVLAEVIMLFFKMQDDIATIAKNGETGVAQNTKAVVTPEATAKPAKRVTKKAAKKTAKKVSKKSPKSDSAE